MSDYIHYRQNRNSDFFGSVEVETVVEQGKRAIFTIQSVEFRNSHIKNGKVVQGIMVNGKLKENGATIIKFAEHQKPWIINPTNCKIIQKMTNEKNMIRWVGLKIELYVDYKISFAKETVSGVRVKPCLPNAELPHLVFGSDEYQKCVSALQTGYKIDAIKKRYTITQDVMESLEKDAQNV